MKSYFAIAATSVLLTTAQAQRSAFVEDAQDIRHIQEDFRHLKQHQQNIGVILGELRKSQLAKQQIQIRRSASQTPYDPNVQFFIPKIPKEAISKGIEIIDDFKDIYQTIKQANQKPQAQPQPQVLPKPQPEPQVQPQQKVPHQPTQLIPEIQPKQQVMPKPKDQTKVQPQKKPAKQSIQDEQQYIPKPKDQTKPVHHKKQKKNSQPSYTISDYSFVEPLDNGETFGFEENIFEQEPMYLNAWKKDQDVQYDDFNNVRSNQNNDILYEFADLERADKFLSHSNSNQQRLNQVAY
ncbi:UNKNOWN [Stylonychia lemnae]|uniref:Uncharacterized protein n=1 Tax=Stylonychia lemnae TaxID=5949 RepID=A0A078AAR1_STYLE|nr:UNKNOWN [Stylonychia lemnae]|eukprot:CDW78931.1 UNKNOWN [Stylonychia lemnae]